MENDESDSRLVENTVNDIDETSGLGFDHKSSDVLNIKRKKRKLKVSIDCGSDELPIGSFLKMRKSRNTKKVKLESKSGNKGKKAVTEVFGGMEDTLASFRKKLKAPKRDIELSGIVGKSASLSSAEKLEHLLDVFGNNEVVVKGKSTWEDEHDMNRDNGLDVLLKGKSKRKFLPSGAMKMADNASYGLHGDKSVGNLLENGEEGVLCQEEGANHSSGGSKDILSMPKESPDLIRQPKSSFGAEAKILVSTSGQLVSSEGVSGDLLPMAGKRSRSGSGSGPCSVPCCDMDLSKEPCEVTETEGMPDFSDYSKGCGSSPKSVPTVHNSSCIGKRHSSGNGQILSFGKLDSAYAVRKREEPIASGEILPYDAETLLDFQNRKDILCEDEPLTSALHNTQANSDFYDGASVQVHDSFVAGDDASGSSTPSTSPDKIKSFLKGPVSSLECEIEENKLSDVHRGLRNTKRIRHEDMAYEGDVVWESLIHDGIHPSLDSDHSMITRKKYNPSSISLESENGGVAAVTAGLKAHAAGPVEKIKFKEALKRKGGLQEYLECRNYILGLWSKDITRILPLSDCDVTDTPIEDEQPRASLIRDIYTFLDRSGYINVGVASGKEKVDPTVNHSYYKLSEGKSFERNSRISIADTEDGVSYITGRVKVAEASTAAKTSTAHDDGNLSEAVKVTEFDPRIHESFSLVAREECSFDVQETIFTSEKPMTSKIENPIDIHSTSVGHVHEHDHVQNDSVLKKKVIVIGAGPAGLTAARHLQRQGFSVTVLEGRGRIGGRVFTDRSSLSVPIDLGASIITGVEADVDTGRRPDPSSLICAQLGLELTVLKSDCPLYDIVTGQKVPADLDEDLEVEYNNLLDDMVLLVAQKGDQAMKMSLEDGLEYVLSKRRLARSGKDPMQHPQRKVHAFLDSASLNDMDSDNEILSPLERRVMNWHFAHLEYGCAALLKEVSLPYWNQDDIYGGFGGAHCMIKGGYSAVVESMGGGLQILYNHVVTGISYKSDFGVTDNLGKNVKVSTSDGSEFSGNAVLITVPLGCLKAETIKFTPELPQWKQSSIQRLGFGVLNKIALEFSEAFWDESVDYFGATAEETNLRGQCFMFWNLKKTVGAPVLIALLVGKAAIVGQDMSSSDHANHAILVLRRLFGESAVPDPVASVVTNWGRDPFSYGAYSYVAIGSSGEDYDLLGRPVENCLFFAGEATCKEYPDTVGGAMLSGLREAVRIHNIFDMGNDYTEEVEAIEAAERHSDSERDEVRDIKKRLEAVDLSNALYKSSFDGGRILTRESLLGDMFLNAKTTAGRLHLAKELLTLPVEALKSIAGTKQGLTTLNLWMLDSMGKDGTQLLRHCVRILVLVSTNLLAVRLSGIGKTIKEKVCVHTSRDIRAIASQLVSVWIEIFRKEKASNSRKKLLRQTTVGDISKNRPWKGQVSGRPPICSSNGVPTEKSMKFESMTDSKSDVNSVKSESSTGRHVAKREEGKHVMSEEEQAVLAAAEATCSAALAAAEAYASSGAMGNPLMQLPKIPSFHKFARREQYAQMDETDFRRKLSGSFLGRQDCLSEIDSRNCRVREWSVDFSAACANLDSSRLSIDNLSQRSPSNEIAPQFNIREHSGESAAIDSSFYTKAWVESAGSEGIKDSSAIDRWQSQAAAADSDFYSRTFRIKDEEDSNTSSKLNPSKHYRIANESSVSQVTITKQLDNVPRGAEHIKQAVVDYVASLLMPLYKARKINKDGYKAIMKKTATKVMEQATDAEKTMSVPEFLDFKRKNKIRAFVDKLIERHMSMKSGDKQ